MTPGDRESRERSREGGKHQHQGTLSRSVLLQWDPSCAGTSEKCAEAPRIVLVKEGGRSTYSQLPALLDGELPGVGARHQGLPTLSFRGLSWLLSFSWSVSSRGKPQEHVWGSCPKRKLPIAAGLKSRVR